MDVRRSYLDRMAAKEHILRRRWHYRYVRFFYRSERLIRGGSVALGVLSLLASIVCVVLLVVYSGFNLSLHESVYIRGILHALQLVFAVKVVYQLVFFHKSIVRESRLVKWVVDILVLVSVIVWIGSGFFTLPVPRVSDFLRGNTFFCLALGAYSLVDICYALSYIPGRRTNPSFLLAMSFVLFIVIGSFVLMLPRCTVGGISYVDSLFVASSAVSITGLSSVDVASTFTPYGLLVLSVLIQLGSLGIITFTSFFALFFTGNTSIYNQLLLRDVIYSKSMNALVPTLLYVLGFTLTVELAGAVVVFFTIPDSLGLDVNAKLVFAAFHSMSSFCNAGFSCVPGGMANAAFMHSNQYIYIVTSVLIFAGSIGFPILVNFKTVIVEYLRRLTRRAYHSSVSGPLHIFDLNTKLVLYTSLGILAFSTAAFFVLEYDNTLGGMSTYERVVQSVFNSLVPRSAGFASVNPASFLDITILLVLVQMFIGGSSQSMAGGIKVNTFATVLLNLRAVILGHKGVTAFKRTINVASVRRANAVVVIAAISFAVFLAVVMLLEPALPAKSLVFEVVSALFTVGSSLGITAELSAPTKVVLSTAMLLGRVGIISLLAGFTGITRDYTDCYPTDNVIIN